MMSDLEMSLEELQEKAPGLIEYIEKKMLKDYLSQQYKKW